MSTLTPANWKDEGLAGAAALRLCDAIAGFRKAFVIVSRTRKATADDVKVCVVKAKLDACAVGLRLLPSVNRHEVLKYRLRTALDNIKAAKRDVLGRPADWGYGEPDCRAEALDELYLATDHAREVLGDCEAENHAKEPHAKDARRSASAGSSAS